MKNRFSFFNLSPWAFSIAVHSAIVSLFLLSNSTDLLLSPQGHASTHLTYIELPNVTETQMIKEKSSPVLKTKSENILPADSTTFSNQTSTENTVATGTENGAAHATALSQYIFGLRQLIEQRKIYPSLSKKMGETGKVIVTLELQKDGTIRDIKIKDTSTFARLNQAALETVAQVQKYKPIPDHISEQQIKVEVPIQFSL